MPYLRRLLNQSNKALPRKYKRIRPIAWAVSVAMLTSSSIVQAENLTKALDSMFLSNSTAAGSFNTQGRTGFSAGSYVARTPVLSINVASFDPPRFNGGCGGIDLYGGAFSFINADQLVKLFRAIVANALSALFWMAIDLVAKPIANVMSKFQALVTSLNMNMRNTCAIGNKIANTVWSSAAENTAASLFKSVSEPIAGAANGFMDSLNDEYKKFGNVNPEKLGNTAKPNVIESPKWGNMTWRALVRSGADQKFVSYGGTAPTNTVAERRFTMQILMSILGTQIISEPAVSPGTQTPPDPGAPPPTAAVTPSNKNGMTGIPWNPTITNISDFVMGPSDGVPIKIIECEDSLLSIHENQCKTVRTRDLHHTEWIGIKGKVNTAIYGDPKGQAFIPGSIVDKLSKCINTSDGSASALSSGGNPCGFTGTQIGVINGTTVPLLFLLQRSQGSIQTMQSVALKLADLVALDYAGGLYKQLIAAATGTFSGIDGLDTPLYSAHILQSIRDEYDKSQKEFNKGSAEIELQVQYVERAMRNIGGPG